MRSSWRPTPAQAGTRVSRVSWRPLGLPILAVFILAAWLAVEGLRVRTQAMELARAHLAYEVAHPGWSFPARVWSAPAALDLPAERLVLEAHARGYRDQCPPADPGDLCPATGELIPRGGLFPEGRQPPGLEGWTRPLALEPLRIGLLVGPDGEIREHLPLDEAPTWLLAAIMQAEDADFEVHHGIDLPGTLRAAWANARRGSWSQGASTLTMQLVRAFSERRERTLARKLWEATAAMALDQGLGKDVILQAYLDAPYLGQAGTSSICGFQAAARYYWGIDARDLSLAQAATLAAILPAPGRWAPDRHPEEAQARRDALLARMGEAGWDVTAALEEPMGASPHPVATLRYPAYLQATRSQLEAALSPVTLYGAGLDVWTALDPAVQEAGDRVLGERTAWVQETLGLGSGEPIQAAAVLLDTRSGLVVAVHDTALEGSTGFSRATQARRQPGSAFKPVVYALAMGLLDQEGKPRFTPASTVPNSPRNFREAPGWSPRNVAGEYSPTSALAMGLAWSQNIATASLLEAVGGPEVLIPFAARLGFDTTGWPHEYGLALGQAEVSVLELARFTGTVARGGELAPARPVIQAVDAAGRVRVPAAPPDEQVLTAEAAALTRDLMRLVVEYGTGGRARGTGGMAGYPGPMIGKTGTTDGERDLWFTGATAHYAGALWLGTDTPSRIGVSASDFAAPLWGWWLQATHQGLPWDELGGPTLERRGICTETGLLAGPSCRIIPGSFLPGTAPRAACSLEHEPAAPRTGEGQEWTSRWGALASQQAEEAQQAEDVGLHDQGDGTERSPQEPPEPPEDAPHPGDHAERTPGE